MKVKILRVKDSRLIDAHIRSGSHSEMPSIQSGWRFNFNRHIKSPNSEAYVLMKENSPNVIEGCLIYRVLKNGIQYMAFVEVAPHNRSPSKTYDFVAGCLIAFACRLSIKRGENHHRGWLTFDVMEENEKDGIKLMTMYSRKYKAVKVDDTTMYISPTNGELLIDEYLNRKS